MNCPKTLWKNNFLKRPIFGAEALRALHTIHKESSTKRIAVPYMLLQTLKFFVSYLRLEQQLHCSPHKKLQKHVQLKRTGVCPLLCISILTSLVATFLRYTLLSTSYQYNCKCKEMHYYFPTSPCKTAIIT